MSEEALHSSPRVVAVSGGGSNGDRALTALEGHPNFETDMEIDLPPESRKVLDVILDNGSIRGFELKRFCGLSYDALIKAAKPLIDNRYITVSGVVNEDTLDGIRFAPLSSSLGSR